MDNADPDVVLERMADSAATVLHYACYRRDFNVIIYQLNALLHDN